MLRVLVALLLTLLVVGCSGDDSTSEGSEVTTGSATSAPAASDGAGASSTSVVADPATCEALADEELSVTQELLDLLASDDGSIESDALDGLSEDEQARVEELQARSEEISGDAADTGCLGELDTLICERVGELPVDEVVVEQMSAACAVLDDQLAAEERMAAIETCDGLADEGAAALEDLLTGVAELPSDERPESLDGEIPSAITDGYVLVYSAIDDRAAELGCTNDVLQPLLCERITPMAAEGPFAEDLLAEMTAGC